jgi:Ca2+-transporting ATPase
MEKFPVRRSDNLVTINMFAKIILHAIFISAVLILQCKTDFLRVGEYEMNTVIFSLFILFQLFNAFNARELGSVSVFKNIKSNKPMLLVFGITFLLQVLLSQYLGAFFGTVALPISVWIKMILIASSIVLISEICKLVKRIINSQTKKENSIKGLIKKNNNA